MGRAHQPGQRPGGSHPRVQAQGGEVQTEPGLGTGDSHVTGQRDAEASAHRRWRRPIARVVLGPRIVRRPFRVYRPYYAPRVRVGVGIGYGGYYGW